MPRLIESKQTIDNSSSTSLELQLEFDKLRNTLSDKQLTKLKSKWFKIKDTFGEMYSPISHSDDVLILSMKIHLIKSLKLEEF